MKLSWKDTDSFLKSPPQKIPAVLIYGPDAGLVQERVKMLIKTVIKNDADPFALCDLPAARLTEDPSKLLDEAKSISLLGGRRVIYVRDAEDKQASSIKSALAALNPSDNLVIVSAGDLGPRSTLRLAFEQAENAAALPCYVEDERDITRVIQDAIKAEGFSISTDAVQYLARHIVGDRGVARQEIGKLIIYMGPQKKIDLDDVRAVTGNASDLSTDDLARHAASGNFSAADRILRQALSEGEAAVSILRKLQNHFLRLHTTKLRIQAGANVDSALAALKPPLFFKHKDSFATQVLNWQLAQIEQVLLLLQTAEARCKQTGYDPDLTLSRAVLSISQLGVKTQARRA